MTNKKTAQNFGGYGDEELIALIRAGDSEAFAALVVRYSEKVRRFSRSYFAGSLTADDWFQEGMIGFLGAVKSYDLSRADVSFASFASVCVKNRLNTVWRSSNSEKNQPLNGYVEYDDASGASVSSAEEKYIEEEKYRFFLDDFVGRLSKTENSVFALYLAGYSYKETAKSLGMSEKSVDNALCRVRSKLKKALTTSNNPV